MVEKKEGIEKFKGWKRKREKSLMKEERSKLKTRKHKNFIQI